MKKLLIVIVILMMSLAFVPSVLATDDTAVSIDDELALVQEQSNEEYNRILNEYSGYNETGLLIPVEDIIYADYYAGAYLNDDKELVVLVTDDSLENRQELENITDNPDLIINKAEYSYNYLKSVESDINNYMLANYQTDDRLANAVEGVGLYDDKNCIIVYLAEYDDITIELFQKTICDTEAVIFEESIGEEGLDASIKAGQQVIVGGLGFSAGFRCRRSLGGGSYEYGFVTSAHKNYVGETVKVGSTTIGEVTARKYSGSVDVAFVEITNGNYSGSNAIYGTSWTLVAGAYYVPAVGSTIYKTGYAGGTSSGTLLSSSYACDCGDVYLTNQGKADYSRSSGDSGGIIYTSGSSKYIVGIHRGYDDGASIYIEALNIVSSISGLGVGNY